MADVEIRRARDEDLETVYEIVAANCRRTLGSADFELDQFQNLWPLLREQHLAVSDMAILGASAIRAGNVEVDVRADARRRGIGTRLLRAVEDAAGPGLLRATAVTLEEAAAPFLRTNGYEKVSEVWLMGVDLADDEPEPAWPEGVEVRTLREQDARAVKELLDLAYTEEPGHVPVSFDEWRHFMLGDPSFEPENFFLVEADGQLVAAALNWKEGYVKDLVVHPAWRRRGLGEALTRQTFRHFSSRGLPRVTLKTDSTNPTQAWRLYERLGMSKERTYEVFEKRL